MEKYAKLHELSRHAELLKGVSHLLDWDHETYMPEGAAHIRAEQRKILAGLIHQEMTSDKFKTALGALIDLKTGKVKSQALSLPKKRALDLWRRDFLKRKKLPTPFVEEFAALTSNAICAWKKAKEKASFKEFSPFLKKIVAFCQKEADYLGYEEHPYDALIDNYEPGMLASEIEPIFDKVKAFSTALVKKQARLKINDSFLEGNFDSLQQMKFSAQILKDMGYDFTHGRVDFSTHPFSSSLHPTDSRITTRVPGRNIMTTIGTLLHEGGHSLYEMGLPQKDYGSPLAEAVSLGIHESQSRFWEIWIGLGVPFWERYFPLLQHTFKNLDKISFEAFYKGINKVQPSLIRVEADEVTYPLHVILRFEIEKGLIEGSIKVDDIPELWNEKMQSLLGVKPKNDAEGCLQDIHWSMGAFGYFPTYALGSLYAASLFEAFTKEHPDYEKRIVNEGLLFIKEFLAKKIYRYGRQYDSLDLIKKATGKAFSHEPFIRYLERKYS